MSSDFRFLLISAMYENGGNTTHRLLDGHPALQVYPFESQLGTRLVDDALASLYPKKYRWPVFALDASPENDFRAIIDEECRVRARTPHVSKFRHVPFDFDDDERGRIYAAKVARTGRSRGANVAAFFQATFEAWKDFRGPRERAVVVGYSPVVVVDAEKVVRDLPAAHVLQVVRNPWSAYADTKKRPVPMSLADYMLGWCVNQRQAQLYARRNPGRVHILRTEDIMENPEKVLGSLLERFGLGAHEALRTPSWNGTPLTEVYPWGTLRKVTPEANRATGQELSAAERAEIREHAFGLLDDFDFKSFG